MGKRWFRGMAESILVVALLLAGGHLSRAFADGSECYTSCPQGGDDAVSASQYENCLQACLAGSQNGPVHQVKFASLAFSESKMRAGASHGQDSEAAAQRLALANCQRNGGRDCKILNTATDWCLALAVSDSDATYGQDGGADRAGAARGALEQCRAAGGKECAVQTAPCSSDDPRWAPPLPPIAAPAAATVDHAAVGTWALDINGGRWLWVIHANGTYEFHSEAPDGVPSHAGTFSASAGRWALKSTSGWNDSGTYKLERNGLVATGRLGTAKWRRLSS